VGRPSDLRARGSASKTFSLLSRCNAVDRGHLRRPEDFDGHIGSVPCTAVAALCCCTSWPLSTLNPASQLFLEAEDEVGH
jgi:hypothetical protein